MIVVAKKDYKTPWFEINKGEKYKAEGIEFFILDGTEEEHKAFEQRIQYRLDSDTKHFNLSKEDFNDVFDDFRQEKLERILKNK